MLCTRDSYTLAAIVEAANRRGITPYDYAISLLETAILAQRPFEEIAEPIARSFDESGMTDEDLNTLITQTKKTAREIRHPKP